MLLIDGAEADFELAVNMLNFDKRGNPNGLDSLGILCSIDDNEEIPLEVFIGLKFDVMSVFTNRGVSTFMNLTTEQKEFMNGECTYGFNAENAIKLYIDVHEIHIDISTLYATVYKCHQSAYEYATILEQKIFNSFGAKSARLISMHPTRQFEGNLENIGTIATLEKTMYVLNELIVDDKSIADEIFFTNWFVPRDLDYSEYSTNNNEISFEKGDEFSDGLNGIVIANGEEINSFSYDRRGFRNGYWDLGAKDPFVNVGYRLLDIDFTGTYFTRKARHDDENLSLSRFDIEKIPSGGWIDRVSLLLSKDNFLELNAKQRKVASANSFKHMIENVYFKKEKISWVDAFTEEKKRSVVLGILSLLDNADIDSEIFNATVDVFSEMFIQFMYAGNINRTDYKLSRSDLSDAIVFVYHPVLKKYFFYEVDGDIDTGVTVDETGISVIANGFKFGMNTAGESGDFTWNNIVKKYRLKEKELSFTGDVIENADRVYTFSFFNIFKDNMDTLGTMTSAYDDLTFEGSSANIFVLKKSDVSDIITKRFGVTTSGYVLGVKYGYIKVK